MESINRKFFCLSDIGYYLLAVIGALGWSIGSAAELVGRIAGDLSVSPNGPAVYRIAIDVPAAANDMKPNIALAYNSNAVNGLAGIGWNLSGFSSITRCGLSIALDSRRQGVNYTNEDRFCLDGQPLIKISGGAYGGNNVEYRAEIHKYQKVTSHGTVGSGPAYFVARMPNGLTRIYGSSTSSRIDVPDVGEVRVWALHKIIDKFSNEVVFEYNERAGGEYDPKGIRWGGLTTYSLEFVYEERPDKRYGYEAGSAWARTQRLTNILYRYQDVTVHDYQLVYEGSLPGTGRSRLATLTQCGTSNCLPPTIFDWQDGGVGWNVQSTTVPGYKQFKAFIDYDGDGDADVVSGEYPGQWQIQTSSQGNLLAPQTFSMPVMGNGDGFTIAPLQFDGDGLGDFMVIGTDGHFHVHISNADGADSSCGLFCDHDTGITPADAGVPSGAAIDINGDGLDELVYFRDQTIFFRRNLGGRFHTFEQATFIGSPPQGGHYSFWNNANFPSVDFNGDGRKDLLVRATEGQPSGGVAIYYDIYLSEYDSYYGDTFSSTVYGSTRLENTNLFATSDILTPDINGDGLADLLFKDAITLRWWTVISDGEGLGSPRDTGIIPIIGKSQIVDYDSDGRDDFLAKQQNTEWRVFLSDGSSYDLSRSISVSLPAVSHAQQLNTYIDAVDLTGDGYRDLLLLGEPDGTERRVKIHNGPRADMLTGISDGLDNTYQLAYTSLSNASIYQPDATSGSPASLSATYLVRGGPRQVVEYYEANDGIGGLYRVSHEYWNAQHNRNGRGFLGFAQIRTLDSRNTRYSTTNYHQDFPYIGRLKFRKITRNPDGPREESFVWGNANKFSNSESLPYRRYYFVRLESSDKIDYERDNQTLIKRVIRNLSWNDDHGVVDKDEEYILTDTWHGWPNNLFYTRRQVMSFDEGLRANRWCLGRATRVDVTKFFPDARPVQTEMRSTSTVYDQSTCNSREKGSGSSTDPSQQLKATYGFDEYGRARTITLNDGNDSLPPRKTEFIYPNSWTPHATTEFFVIDNQPNHEQRRTWHEELGLLETITNVQGLTTARDYDEFGRLTRERQVTLGAETELTYHTTCNGWCPANQKYSITGTRADGFWSTTHYDPFGREVGKTHALIDGESRQAFIYDSLGRLVKKNVPYVAGDVGYWIHFAYDNLDRRTAERKPVNESDFTGLSETLFYYWGDYVYRQNAESQWTVFLHRPDGLIHQVSDARANVAEYRHTPFGEISSISDPDDAVPTTEMTYNSLGYMTSRVDNATGAWSLNYNVFGELIGQHDDRGHSATVNYDQLGRITERIEDEGISSWSYVQSGNGFGLLDTVAGPTDILPSGYAKQHIYNGLAQISRTVTTIDGVPYQTDYAYNPQGQMSSTTYPSTITTGARSSFNFSYTNGYLHLVDKDDGVGSTMPIYEVFESDASGRETRSISGGDFLESQHTYDRANTRLTGIKTGALPLGVPGIQDYGYTWDALGNLTERTDRNRNVTESFVYDQLSRLTETWLNAQRIQSLTYHADGRINTRLGGNGYLGVGAYEYGSGNAVISIAGDRSNTYHYDGNGNMDCRGDTTSICANGDIVQWYSFNKPSTIYYGSDYSSFTYGPDRKRIKQSLKDGSTVKSIQYVDKHFEREIQGNSTRYRSFVFANDRVVYMLQETRSTSSCGGTTFSANGYFIKRDHQGSVDQMILDAANSLAITSSFDSFGKRRNPDWTADDSDLQLNTNHVTNRGYTSHEHIDHVRLIHMGGRVQDPIIGQMISADPLIGDLANPQSLNRYSYVMNNPSTYIDPTGFACQAGSDSDTGGCKPASRGDLNRVRELTQAIQSIKGAGTVLVSTDTSKAVGEVAASAGFDSFMLGNIDVVSAFLDSGFSTPDWIQRSELDGPNINIFLKRQPRRPKFTGIGRLEIGADLFLGFVGVSGFSGFTFDRQGTTCLVTTICAQLGLGAFAGYGGAGAVGVGEPLEEGTKTTVGLFAVGGVGSVGGGSLDVNHASLSLGKGFIGEGLGGAGGIQLCANNVSGCK